MKRIFPRLAYIKPTRHKHESGYRTFEVGYCDVDEKHNAVNIQIIGERSDHIYQDFMMIVGDIPPFSINMDLTNNGYIRLYCLDKYDLVWGDELGLSSMELTAKPREIET